MVALGRDCVSQQIESEDRLKSVEDSCRETILSKYEQEESVPGKLSIN